MGLQLIKEMTMKYLICGCLLAVILSPVWGQIDYYDHLYPALPFDVHKVIRLGYDECTEDLVVYKHTEGAVSGEIWSEELTPQYRSRKAKFLGNAIETWSAYDAENNPKWELIYNYDSISHYNPWADAGKDQSALYEDKARLVSVIERFLFREEDGTPYRDRFWKYYYEGNLPFRKVEQIDSFPDLSLVYMPDFDKEGNLVYEKVAAKGTHSRMESILGLGYKCERMHYWSTSDTMQTVQTIEKKRKLKRYGRKVKTPKPKKPKYKKQRKSINSLGYTKKIKVEKYKRPKTSKKGYYEEFFEQRIVYEERTKLNKDKKPLKTFYYDDKGTLLMHSAYTYEEGLLKKIIHYQHIEGEETPKEVQKEYFKFNYQGLLQEHILEEGGKQIVRTYDYYNI